VPTVVRIRGVGVCIGKSSGSTHLRLWKGLVSTSVILNHCIRTRFFGFFKQQCPCGCCGVLLTDFCRNVGLPDQRWVKGLSLCPFVVYPPSCWGGRFHTTEQFMGVSVLLVLCCHFWGHVLTLFQIFCYFSTFACR